jgi:endonuclease YncB( thermonuclease family)
VPLAVLLPLAALTATPRAAAGDGEAGPFALCSGAHRVTCVVDGDTFWYRGAKIRLADINAPEVSEPGCAREAALARQATARLLGWLNAGPFTLAPNGDGTGRDRDRYGRLLRTVTRGGESAGTELVREGLAERWTGSRGDWCGA